MGVLEEGEGDRNRQVELFYRYLSGRGGGGNRDRQDNRDTRTTGGSGMEGVGVEAVRSCQKVKALVAYRRPLQISVFADVPDNQMIRIF